VAVAYAALCNDVIGELLHFRAAAFEERHLEAAVMIEVYVECRLREVMAVVEAARQPLGKIAHLMIVDIDQRGDAGPRTADFDGRLLQPGSGQVTDCLRPIGVPARAHETVNLCGEVIVNRNGQARHWASPMAAASRSYYYVCALINLGISSIYQVCTSIDFVILAAHDAFASLRAARNRHGEGVPLLRRQKSRSASYA
jgi:hypothetical protein